MPKGPRSCRRGEELPRRRSRGVGCRLIQQATRIQSFSESLEMANTTRVAETAATVPSREEISRVEEWTREPIDPEALTTGTAVRRAVDAALAEIEAGHEKPSVE